MARSITPGPSSSRRVGRSGVQRHVLYLGEINDSQRAAWQKSIAVFDEQEGRVRQCALFPEDRAPLGNDPLAVQVRPEPMATLPAPHVGCLLAGRSTLVRAPTGHLLRPEAGMQS
jgi:hypothetical protein